jgi:hypoxanthine phosphoribosyltransferase
MGDDKLEILIDAAKIRKRVAELGREINRDYAGRFLTVLVVLKGGIVFASDLVRAIDIPVSLEMIGLRSYGKSTSSSGVVEITLDLSSPIEGQHVLVIEDIVDTGLTLDYLLENLRTRRPASVRVCALLHKPSRARAPVKVDYKGFTVPDRFVVGYGMDLDEKYRNLPYIAAID